MSAVSTHLDTLKHELQDETDASKFERLAAALLSRLLDVPIAVARSGFQYGADGGTVGYRGRRFRLECKKYRDNRHLSERELLGEIDQALARDEALEAWFLVTTLRVPEQIKQSLDQAGERKGVPIVIIDWTDHEIPPLAALCATDPDLVETEFSKASGAAARALLSVSGDAINRLRRHMESWWLGFAPLRQQSHDKLDKIWNSPRESNSALRQNAAGGAQTNRVKRNVVQKALNAWWQGLAESDAPAAVIGWEGTGKTWAVLDWLIDSKTEQPVVLIVPSSAIAETAGVSESTLKWFLAECLHAVSGVRDAKHWQRRLDYLLKRPADEGPVLTVVFDGLNQHPSVSWLSLLKILQGEIFAGRVRVIVTTRKHHFESKLSSLKSLIVPAIPIEVDRYDTVPGGELEQMLEYAGLVRDDLHSDVLEMARTPRLFELVVRLKERLGDSGQQVTIHRLLWEYGRDSLGVRAGRSFNQDEWKDWLKEIARQHREGIQNSSVSFLGETVNRPDLTPSEVYARLSDIIDGKFATRNVAGDLQLTPTVVAHALGAALLKHLDLVDVSDFETLDVTLRKWLDPIAGFDQPAEILRAAVSILVEQGRAAVSPVPGVLLKAWLQTQNVPDAHRLEITSLAPNFPEALLDVVEYSESRIDASARSWAVTALHAIPRTDIEALSKIVPRARRWLMTISRDVDMRSSADQEHNKWRLDQIKQRIGTASSGPVSIVGLDFTLADQSLDSPKAAVPSIIEGFPLAHALPIFEAAAVELAVSDRSECWDGLEWISLLNEVDPAETAKELRQLSENLKDRNPEPGVHPDLPKRIAALLLWLIGRKKDEDAAAYIDPGIGRPFTYEKDYLPRPGNSLFPLERRHAEITLNDTDLSLQFRTQRIGDLWLDPTFVPPDTFVAELRKVAAGIAVEKLNRHSGRTIEDHNFQELEPALARCAPELLADLIRRKMQSVATCPQESRYWAAIHATDDLVLAGEAEMAALRTLRLSGNISDKNDDCFAANELLLMEIRDLNARQQIDTLIRANLEFFFFTVSEVLRPLSSDDVDVLIDSYNTASTKEQRDLLTLLSFQSLELTDYAWSWIEEFRRPYQHDDFRKFIFRILAQANVACFGRTLQDDDWSWNPDEHIWVNHYGTDALIEATSSLSFNRLAPRLAPWRLLEAVRRRGSDPAEVRLAAEIFGRALAGNEIKEVDPGSDLSIDLTREKSLPFSYSVELRRSENETENIRLATNPEARTQAHQRSIDTAASRISEARRSGAKLFHAILDRSDFEPALQHAPDIVEHWLEGWSRPTEEFQRRVRLAEGAFMALCEALLTHDPERGSRLWRVIQMTVTTRYIGEAGVDELLHMIFRAPDSTAVAKLRKEISLLKDCDTDRALFDLAIAASHNGKNQWFKTVIKEDRLSPYAWRRKRAAVLEGFSTNNALAIKDAWPSGELKTPSARLTQLSARSQWTEACARHWWRIYLEALNPDESYAAWVLFLRSADRRVFVWMQEEIDAAGALNEFLDLKVAHVRLNRNNLKRAMKKREEKFDQNFLYRKARAGVGPWV